MKKRICALLLVLMLTLTFPAYAESAQPENALSIADSFDPADWSFGELDWLTPLEDYLHTLTFGDEVTLTSPQEDIVLSRDMYVEDFARECRVEHMYQFEDEGLLLCQVKISAPVQGDEDFAALVTGAQALYTAMAEKVTATEEHSAFTDDQGAFEALLARDEEMARYFWNGRTQIAELSGKPLGGILSIGYEPTRDGVRFFVTLGGAVLR